MIQIYKESKGTMSKLQKNKKGIAALNLLLTGGITLVVVVVALAISAQVITDVGDGFTAGSVARGVVDNGSLAIGNLSGQLGLIGTVIALTVVLLILITLLFRQFAGGVR